MTTTLQAITYKAQTHPRHHFGNLSRLLDEDRIYRSWGALRKNAAPGIDSRDAEGYANNLRDNVIDLVARLKQGAYRANRIKRTYIPKGKGKQRPLGLPTIEDKLLQQAVSDILSAIWEPIFHCFSYGYRPNKSAHGAVQSLGLNLQYKGYGYIVEADIKGFFDHVDHTWLERMLNERIRDKRFLSLIKQWLKAKIVEPDGKVIKPMSGTPQGGVISPILANIYLHYVLDEWFAKVVKPRMRGRCMLIRYCDDFVVAFQYAEDAHRFFNVLPKRLEKFGLAVAKEKTQLLRFSRFHPSRKRRFKFLGFDYYWSKDRKGSPRLRRRTAVDKQKEALNHFRQWIRQGRHKLIRQLIPELRRKLQGFYNYFGLIDNSRSISVLYSHVLHSLYKWLNRRSQRKSYGWGGLKEMLLAYGVRSPRVRKRGDLVVDWY